MTMQERGRMNKRFSRAFSVAVALLAVFLVAPAMAQIEVQSEVVPGFYDSRQVALDQMKLSRSLLDAEQGANPVGIVATPSIDKLQTLARAATDQGRLQVGVNEPINVPVRFGINGKALGQHGSLQAARGGYVWFTTARSEGASAVRLHLTNVVLPKGVELYGYTERGEAFGPYTAEHVMGEGELWTHTVLGSEIRLQLRVVSRGAANGSLARTRFDIAEIVHLGDNFTAAKVLRAPLDEDSFDKAFCSFNASCVENASCSSIPSAIQGARNAVAHIQFSVGSGSFICSGGLLNDANTSTTVPYFLTANHCLSSTASANSIEAFFQFSTNCGSSCFSANSSLPRMLGSSLLATNSSTDFTLLQLNGSIPGGLTLMGWSTSAVANSNGTDLFRISPPKGAPQAYSRQDVSTSAGTCGSIPRGNFIYSRDSFGATEGGSSGSPVLNSSGQVVGQLFGACGTNTGNVCASNQNATVDGAFAVTFNSISQFINNPGNTSCHSGALGSANYCRSNCKCDDGEGDCDNNNECASGTTCVNNVGPTYGFASWVDVCVASGGGGGPNSCVGNCGSQASGGCWCDSQCASFGDCCADKVSVCG